MIVYQYPATVTRIVDGDTVAVVASVFPAPALTAALSVRLDGINAAEHDTPGGAAATAHLGTLLQAGQPVTLQVVGADKYRDRVDGRIVTVAGVDVADRMVTDGYAARWDGHGPRPVPPWPIPAAT